MQCGHCYLFAGRSRTVLVRSLLKDGFLQPHYYRPTLTIVQLIYPTHYSIINRFDLPTHSSTSSFYHDLTLTILISYQQSHLICFL